MGKGDQQRRPRPELAMADADDDDEEDAEAIARALEENPELAAELNPDQVRKTRAAAEKEAGNAAFKARDFEQAIVHFTAAIEADNTDAVFYSNRSAALAHLTRWEEALADAKSCVTLKPEWGKAWVRMGSAHVGLQEWSEAKEAFGRAMEIEPDDKSIQTSWEKADYQERQASQKGKFAFNKRKMKAAPASRGAAPPDKKRLLSFDEDEEEEQG